ncbi:RNA polymerase sigma factor [Pedobacter sp. AW31-3R]|uniref:RNA polymerase sigma factor n=1 Tax=Pedobacter sp. AW31-3R TaxID=3445781 RepID=UPI003FA006BA
MAGYRSLTDSELTVLLSSGDDMAYTEIYNRYHGPLYIHVFHKLHDREESKDLVHDFFISLWKNRNSLEIKSSLSVYLYTAVRYRVFDAISRKKVASKYILSIQQFAEREEAITDHRLRENELLLSINKEIAALPAKMRAVFELSRKENLSHRQIAEKLDLSESTVKKQVNNALKILRVKLSTLFFIFF